MGKTQDTQYSKTAVLKKRITKKPPYSETAVLKNRSTQKPQYLNTAVLKNPHGRNICDFFSVLQLPYCEFWVLRFLCTSDPEYDQNND